MYVIHPNKNPMRRVFTPIISKDTSIEKANLSKDMSDT